MGAGLGALCRYLLQVLFMKVYPALPVGTLVSNLIGCFLIGLLFPWLGMLPKPLKMGVITGFLGALTTLSSFSYEVNILTLQKNWSGTLLITVITIFGGLGLSWLGLRISQVLGLGVGI